MLAHGSGVAGNAAFGATEGEVHQRAFPAHPHGEGGDFAEFDVWGVADAAFTWAKGQVVLDTVAGERVDFAVVHPDGEGDGDHPFWPFGAFAEFLGEVEDIGGEIELAGRHGEHGILEEVFHGV